jgi:hypothetical protein
MLLRDISAGLRLQKITIEEDLKGIAFFVPEHILHYFAVDCAERALERIPEEKRGELFRKAKDLLETRKRWIEGDVSDQELASYRAAYRAAYRASYRASEWADERKIQAIRLAEMIEEYLEALSLLVRTLEAYRLKLPIALELWKQEGEEVLF